MKYLSFLSISSALLLGGIGLSQTVSAKSKEYYSNPVINQSAPDPTVIRSDDGTYYLYATENVRNVPIFKSDDLVNWELVGTAFTNDTRPQMVPDGNIWAPDIQRIGDRYVLYYSKSRWGGEWECGIGVATADSPEGPFTDCGPLFISNEIGVQNSIDPIYVAEGDKKYLFWGSFRRIYAIELSKDGLKVKEGAKPIQIAGTLTEGTNIFKHDGYYYLVGSAGSCCDGERSTYHVVVARSKDLLGPYVNKEGVPAMENGFTTILSRSKEVIGPGHNANFVTDDAGQFWLLYHGFGAAEPNEGRKVYLDRVVWGKDGWPTINAGEPSSTAEKPIIKKRKRKK
ncbi:MAG: family 43 glycosylhydrolase [Muribaculaceae bacterium]|nr:family 43 glycosylhydrolase [Muribaculaceae bacterium]